MRIYKVNGHDTTEMEEELKNWCYYFFSNYEYKPNNIERYIKGEDKKLCVIYKVNINKKIWIFKFLKKIAEFKVRVIEDSDRIWFIKKESQWIKLKRNNNKSIDSDNIGNKNGANFSIII